MRYMTEFKVRCRLSSINGPELFQQAKAARTSLSVPSSSYIYSHIATKLQIFFTYIPSQITSQKSFDYTIASPSRLLHRAWLFFFG